MNVASNNSGPFSIVDSGQDSVDVKEENINILPTYNEKPNSSGPNSEDYVDKFIQQLSSDELDLSIEIFKQLQKALTNVDESKSIGEFAETDREIKLEKQSGKVLNDPVKCASQTCSSNKSNTERTAHKVKHELSYDEIDISIEIVKQLQNTFFYPNEPKKFGESSESHREIKAEVVLNDPLKCSEEQKFSSQIACTTGSYTHSNVDKSEVKLSDNELKLSIEIIEQIQKALDQTDGSKGDGKCTEIHRDIKQEKSVSTVVNPEGFLEDQKSYLLGCSGKCNDNIDRFEGDKHLDLLSLNIISNITSYFPDSLSSDIENNRVASSCMYKNIYDINSTNIKQTKAEEISNFAPLEASLNNFNASKDIGKASCVEKTLACKSYPAESSKCGSLKTQKNIQIGKKPFECRTYGSQFARNGSLKRHMIDHTKEKRFDCQTCGTKFTQSSGLKQHMRIHTGERPFDCQTCGTKFAQSSVLKQHMRIHTGERPFDCKTCGAKFKQRGHLKKHIIIHTGEKPFNCESCGAKFRQTYALKRHMIIHTGERPFNCKSCGTKFAENYELKRHMRIHTGNRHFNCKSCGAKFTQSSALNRHMKIHICKRPFD